MRLNGFLETTHSEYLNEGIKLSQRDYKELLADSNILIGFEAEFLYDREYSFHQNVQSDAEVNEIKQQEFLEVAHELSQIVGAKITPNTDEGNKHDDIPDKIRASNQWYLDLDGSVEPLNVNERSLSQGMEIVSPPLLVTPALDSLDSVLEWIYNSPDANTTQETGLHISVSYKGANPDNVDPLKLLLLLDEEDALNEFGRSDNIYASSHMLELLNFAQNQGFAEFVKQKQSIDFFINTFRKQFPRDKYQSFNWGKFLRQGYMEFRIMGNQGYEARNFQTIRRNILTYAALMKISYDPQSYRREYLMKLYKFLQRIAPKPELPSVPNKQEFTVPA